MLSRSYNTKIQIWLDVETPDGFGGFVNVPTLIKSTFSKIETKGASFKFQQLGLNDFKQPVIFSIRGKGNSINESNFIIYKDQRFNVKAIENVDFNNLEINILCDAT